MRPFLKWPGGKQWLIAKYGAFMPSRYNRYFEPFVGGGAVFFKLMPKRATISDINPELINVYITMRNDPDGLKKVLVRHQKLHNKEYYYKIRASEPISSTDMAGKFLYLNRTCYNGMYRVNKQGKFNVPIGTKNNCTYDLDLFEEYANALYNVKIVLSDFSRVIKDAQDGDLLFADPPYTIAHNQNSFIKYNEHLFTWADQKRLLLELCGARERGVTVFATNANYQALREMYTEANFFITIINRYSSISGKAERRGKQEELLITSKPILGGQQW